MKNSDVEAVALGVRSLAMDAIEAAQSGHPGLPLGLAEIGALLYGEFMNYNPDTPQWTNRDRLVLSAGHGSMLLYSLLHLSGFDLPLEEIKRFRQLGSRTPGHPELGHTAGVETTTGPLGQGIGNAVGIAIAESMSAARYNTKKHRLFDHFVYCIAGDGCMMEGISSEAASLAGHLQLGKLIVFYDDNKITIDGSTDIAFTEDVAMRFRSYGWHIQTCDAYDLDDIRRLHSEAKAETSKPSLIILKSLIGKGAPGKSGTSGIHGAPLGATEIAAAKTGLKLPVDEQFTVPDEAYTFFAKRRQELNTKYQAWQTSHQAWKLQQPELHQEWVAAYSGVPLRDPEHPTYSIDSSIATRSAGQKSLQAYSTAYPFLVGGSADLAASNKTKFPGITEYAADNRAGISINYGVREHGMAAINNGIALYGGFKSFCSTFLVFSDYMRAGIRLAAIMKLPTIFVCTHDSFYVGEDGPTHQPVEHCAALRLIPNLHVYRPGDAEETDAAWEMALRRTDGPVVLALTRQNLRVYPKHDSNWRATARRGAYIVKEASGKTDIIIAATGSEVNLALEAADIIEKNSSKSVRIVSVISQELFLAQDQMFRDSILTPGIRVIVAEAGTPRGWEVLTNGSRKDIFGIDGFGTCGEAEEVAAYIGFTPEKLAELAMS